MTARRDPPLPSQIVLDVSEILSRRGHAVESAIAEETLTRLDDLETENTLYLLKSYTDLSLSLAGVLHARGARLLNPYPSSASCRNKIISCQYLRAGGIPSPRSWVTGDMSLLLPLVRNTPLIVKPCMGWRGIGVKVVRTPEDVKALPIPEGPMLVQEFLEGTGEDLRLYVAGEQVFAIRKPFSAASYSVPGRSCPVTPQERDIALRCGRAFGLGLYGMDLIETPQGPSVVDVNCFPGYKGAPDAAEAVADYIEKYAAGKTSLALPSPGSAG
jgi:ribosomal protein S6--L-glutamate ligase